MVFLILSISQDFIEYSSTHSGEKLHKNTAQLLNIYDT